MNEPARQPGTCDACGQPVVDRFGPQLWHILVSCQPWAAMASEVRHQWADNRPAFVAMVALAFVVGMGVAAVFLRAWRPSG